MSDPFANIMVSGDPYPVTLTIKDDLTQVKSVKLFDRNNTKEIYP